MRKDNLSEIGNIDVFFDQVRKNKSHPEPEMRCNEDCALCPQENEGMLLKCDHNGGNMNQTERVLSEITVRQKEGVTHTKFTLIDGKNPFPMVNFNLAKHWAARGLLNEETEKFMRELDPTTPTMFR